MFDFLVSADLLIDDFSAAVRTMQASLGFGDPRPQWYAGGEGRGFEVVFLRTDARLPAAPTRLEVMAATGVDPDLPAPRTLPHMPGLRRAQAKAPVRTHGTVFAVSDMDEAIERVRQGGYRHWLDAASELMPYHRLWVGVSEEEKDVWIPGDDGGLLIELVEAVTIPGVMGSAEEPQSPPQLPLGAMTRIAARRWLVPDLDRSLASLHATFDCATGPVVGTPDGSRTAPIVCAHPRSAVVDLVQPVAGSSSGDLVGAHGSLPWTIVIAVNDLAAKADDLDRRGTPFTLLEDEVTGAAALAPELGATLGVPFEFVYEPA